MIYLNIGFFVPFCIIVSLPLFPLLFFCLIQVVKNFEANYLYILIFIVLLYFLLLTLAYFYSKSKKNYLIIEEKGYIGIKYPGIQGNLNTLDIKLEDIIRIEYYRLCSVKSWLLLFDALAPKCAFIIYTSNNKEKCVHIGYPKYCEIKKMCNNHSIDFKVK